MYITGFIIQTILHRVENRRVVFRIQNIEYVCNSLFENSLAFQLNYCNLNQVYKTLQMFDQFHKIIQF